MPFTATTASATTDILKDILAIVGGIAALGGSVLGAYLGIKRMRDKRIRQAHEDSVAVTGKFARLEAAVSQVEASAENIEQQFAQFCQSADARFQKIQEEIDTVQGQCIRHASTQSIDGLQKEISRITTKLDRIGLELIQYRETVSDKYLSIASYQSDIVMLTNNFDALRQSIRDLNLLLTQGRKP